MFAWSRSRCASLRPCAELVSCALRTGGKLQHVLGKATLRVGELAAFDEPFVRELAQHLEHRDARLGIGVFRSQSMFFSTSGASRKRIERSSRSSAATAQPHRASRRPATRPNAGIAVARSRRADRSSRQSRRASSAVAAGRSLAPSPSSGSRRSSRAASALGGSSRRRGAASSIASGKPSRWSTIVPTAAELASFSSNSGLTICARCTKSSDRRIAAQRANRVDVLGAQMKRLAARYEDREPRALREQRADPRGRRQQMLEVIEDEQRVSRSRRYPRPPRLASRRPARVSRARGRRRGNERRFRDRPRTRPSPPRVRRHWRIRPQRWLRGSSCRLRPVRPA